MAIDGYGWGVYTSIDGVNWTKVSPSNQYLSVSAMNTSSATYYAVRSDHTLWIVTGTTWTQIGGMNNASQVSVDATGTVYVLGTDGYVYHYSGSGSAWDKLNGSGNTWLTNGGSMEVWAIGPASGGNSIYRFSDTGLQHVRTISGSSTCDQNHFERCGVITHTAKLQAGWNSRMGAQQSASSPAQGSLAVSASADQNDPFACLEDDTACQPTTLGNVECPVAGNLVTDLVGISIRSGIGAVLLRNLSGAAGVPGSCIKKGGIVQVCDFDVTQSGTNQPTYSTNVVTDAPPGLSAWWDAYWCVIVDGYVTVCRPIPGSAEKTTNAGPAYCPNP